MTRTNATELEVRSGRDEGQPPSRRNWLAEIREMRGRVIYDQGRRPGFRTADGRFDDPDPIDLHAYHIIARAQGRAVACTRIVPLAQVRSTAILSTVGELRFATILRDLGATRERTCEASRWIVEPEYRGRLGPAMVAATWAVASWLSAGFAFVLSSTGKHQDVAQMRMGARAVEGLPLFPAPAFNDQVRLLYFDVPHPSESMRRRVAEAAAMLNLDGVPRPAGELVLAA